MSDSQVKFCQKPFIHRILLILIGVLIYSNTFHAPFVFDDTGAIAQNPLIRDLGRFLASLRFTDARVVGNFTFALNYALNGTDVTGYHLFNLFIHLANALLVYRLVLLTLKTPFFSRPREALPFPARPRNLMAFCVALLFIGHPLQTQAVTYVVQRFTSLAAMFYLLSFFLYIAWRLSLLNEADGLKARLTRYFLYAASILSAALALGTKQISITLPVMLLLYEAMFFAGSLRKRALYVFPFIALGCAVLAMTVTQFGSVNSVAAHDSLATNLEGVKQLPRWQYLLTQFRVTVTYLRLLVFPINQNLDYDYPVSTTFFQPAVISSFVFLLLLMGLAVYLAQRSRTEAGSRRFEFRLVSFGLFWFFIALSVESSIIPIDDVIMEHRLYLPSFGFFLAAVSGTRLLIEKTAGASGTLKKTGAAAAGLAAICLFVATYVRNNTWADTISLYEDITRKSPLKARPHVDLGVHYESRGLFDKAAREYSIALLLNPRDALAHYNLASLYYNHGYLDKALEQYEWVIAVNPDSPYSYQQIGLIFYRQGRYPEALDAFQTAVRLQPELAQARYYVDVLSKKIRGRPIKRPIN